MKILFIDTNIFIQCRDLEQLSWPKTFRDEEHLLLFIPRAVQEEIDRHKQEGNSRRAKRARKANSFIRRIILTEDTKLVIRTEKPIVEISFTPPLRNDCHLPDFLDLSRPDDRIIAEILRYRNKYPEHDVSILTHDTNPVLTAKRCGLSYYIIPDNWLLPPEPDSKDKRIIKLENHIKELQNNYPIIEVCFVDDSGNETKNFSIEIVSYETLTEDELDVLLNEVQRRYPMKTDFSDKPQQSVVNQLTSLSAVHRALGYRRKFIPPSAEKNGSYQNEKYPDWIDKVRNYLLSLPEKFEKSTRSLSFSIKVNNNGNVPAENAIVEFKAFGGIFLKPPDKNDEENSKKDKMLKFPQPPIPPKGKWVKERNSLFSAIHAFNHLTKGIVSPAYEPLPKHFIPKPHDRNAFYWKNRNACTISKLWTFECDEFRHKVESKVFDMTIVIPPSNGNIEKCAIECLVTAKNLPKPIKYVLKANIGYVKGNIIEKTIENFCGFDILK